jgi:hypothetical protein
VTETEILMKAGDSGHQIVTRPIEARYPPGQATHFRAVRDVGAIALYVISYLMVKWGIESVRPGTWCTYGGPGTARDVFGAGPAADLVFEWLMFFAALPLTAFYVGWHAVGRIIGVPVVQSLGRSAVPLGRLFTSVMLLPVLLAVAIAELIGKRAGLRVDLVTAFVRCHYAAVWRKG